MPLSYPCQKFVLQHLEANSRIQLSHRCPSLEPIDKTMPLRINFLGISLAGLNINSKLYQLSVLNTSLEPKDLWAPYLYSAKQTQPLCSQIVVSTEFGSQSLNYFFKKALRSELIKVQKLEIKSGLGLCWDLGNLNFQVKELQVSVEILDSVIPRVDESSFPLKCLELIMRPISRAKGELLYHRIVQTAEVLKIYGPSQHLLKLLNSRVHMHFGIRIKNELIQLIDQWLEYGRKSGTHFSFILFTNAGDDAAGLWKMIQRRYAGRIQNEICSTDTFKPLLIRGASSTVSCEIGREADWKCTCDIKIHQ